MHNGNYPHSPGDRGVSTSIESGEAIKGHLARMQARVFDAVRDAGAGGLTSMEAAGLSALSYATAQRRLSELRRIGRVRDSGVRRRNPSGKRAICWAAVEVANG